MPPRASLVRPGHATCGPASGPADREPAKTPKAIISRTRGNSTATEASTDEPASRWVRPPSAAEESARYSLFLGSSAGRDQPAKFGELGLHPPLVHRPHANQDLLPGRQGFELRIGEFIA